MKGRPPRKALTPDQERAASAFIDGAGGPDAGGGEGAPPPGTSPAARRPAAEGRGGAAAETERPWEAAWVREDVVKGYALRLPEPLYLKLKWVAEQTGRSMNAVCREAVEAEVEAFVERENGGAIPSAPGA